MNLPATFPPSIHDTQAILAEVFFHRPVEGASLTMRLWCEETRRLAVYAVKYPILSSWLCVELGEDGKPKTVKGDPIRAEFTQQSDAKQWVEAK